ncbi:MAG: hypothetical protein ACREFP_22025 [Acetobacteraceae bacterium]
MIEAGLRDMVSRNAGGTFREAPTRRTPPLITHRTPNAASHSRITFPSIASNTGAGSPGEALISCMISAIAACCASAASRSAVRAASSAASSAIRRRSWATPRDGWAIAVLLIGPPRVRILPVLSVFVNFRTFSQKPCEPRHASPVR